MVRRRLSVEEEALWTALTRSVRPIRAPVPMPSLRPAPLPVAPLPTPAKKRLTVPPPGPVAAPPQRTPAAILDNGWERRIRSGAIIPEMSIDLHGHSLSAAHARLNHALSAALAQGARVLLVVTGKPPKAAASGGEARRGAIRGEIGHWLETSPYADRIASVRVAHPRHGGTGALYLILRRKK
ncbi:DNA-nicking endonuclease, Smr domain [Sphingobium sp. AP50]|uniref:Smr/MutS family protein n=1 Tax=Sphingobium sp. AP50 TaxID=1884369 RepID=UPI0008AAA45B|nr:Smr/MutS family protein [Sphingobium sp. AP50]SEI70515.1 DNA-nicking endonuclease, Smr domain [Sphingobium sp. AP50]